MARQEIASTFSDGLMMDLNPINTPKSVLTDCLNGTYITYNGNEFVLQNDMGNYKLKNCKLPTNFIPVGVKGYGDILYIVSYNPITKETEIGSYPAPQSIFTTGDSEEKIADTDDLAPFTWEDDGNLAVEYPTIIKNNKKPIFIFTDSNEEAYKLNPGDEFKFTGELTPLDFIYQHLNFYIIDEDNKLYDIDDTQIYENGSLVSSDTMRKVFWETPGWLAAQYDLYVPDKFNLNLKSLNVPEFLTAQSNNEVSQAEGKPLDELEPDEGYFKVSMDLSSQTIITDKLFQTELNKHFGNINDDSSLNTPWEKNQANTYDHLYIRYLIRTTNSAVKEEDYGTFKGIVVSIDDTHTQDYTNGVIEGEYIYYDIPVWKHNYQDDIITAYNNVRPIWFCKNPDKKDGSEDLDIANYHGVVELTAYPIIKYNGLILKYTQFSTTQRFPLNTLKNSSDITIADSIYKWSVDDDSCTISFNINGPFINASDISGRYEIYRINLFNYSTSFPSKTAKPDLNNPVSMSHFFPKEDKILTVDSDGNPASFEFIESNKDPKTKIDTLIPSVFTEERKLLMCEGNLSNLVLYGQNTINVDWSNSNKYKLIDYRNVYTNPDYNPNETINEDTNPGYLYDPLSEKIIYFSKEGGIYIFRVILEQEDQKLAESRQILIPSEAFNEWFGSIDNYNNIYENQWVNKFPDFINITSFNMYNPTITIKKDSNDFAIYDGKELYTDLTKFGNDFSSIFRTYNGVSEKNHISRQPINNKDFLKINYSKLIESITIDADLQKLPSYNLWNSKISQDLECYEGSIKRFTLTYKDKNEYIYKSEDTNYDINYLGTEYSVPLFTEKLLFPNSFEVENEPISLHVFNNKSHSNTQKITQVLVGWNVNFDTIDWSNIGNNLDIKEYDNGITDTTHEFFRKGLEKLYNTSSRWCPLKVTSSNFVPYSITQPSLVKGDRNGTPINNPIITNTLNNPIKSAILMHAKNKANVNSQDGVVILYFRSNDVYNDYKTILSSLKYKKFNSFPTTIYISTISNDINIPETSTYSINKIWLYNNINLLRVDDEYLSFKNIIKEIDINSQIKSSLLTYSSDIFNNQKINPNISIDTIYFTFSWNKNNLYNNIFTNFNDSINTYNEAAVTEYEDLIDTSNIVYMPDSVLVKHVDPKTVINKLVSSKSNEQIDVNNVCFNNDDNTLAVAVVLNADGSKICRKSGAGSVAYWYEINGN